jgi:hypothetical protein
MSDHKPDSVRRTSTRLGLVVVGAVALIATFLTVENFTAKAPAATLEQPTLRTSVMAHERLIATCMHQRGFEYVVAVPADLILQEAKERAEATPGAPTAEPSVPPDPNDAIVAKLTPARQDAYQAAYWGTGTADQGCYYGTYAQAWGRSVDQAIGEGDRLVARVVSDRRVVRALARYVSCMDGRGLVVTDTDTIGSLEDEVRAGPGTDLDKDRRVRAMEAADDACSAPYSATYNTVYLELSD